MNNRAVSARIVDRLLQVGTHALGRRHARRAGAEIGVGVRFMGMPLVARHADSRIVVGDDVTLCSWSRWTALGVAHAVVLRTLAPGAMLHIGPGTGISGGSFCSAVRLEIGARCLIGADVLVSDTDFHALEPVGRTTTDWRRIRSAAVRIGDDVFIGARAVILKGVEIGDGCVIGAGSVVTRSIPPRSIAAGNPAHVVRQL